jgi:Fe2+ transport system protein FeoA
VAIGQEQSTAPSPRCITLANARNSLAYRIVSIGGRNCREQMLRMGLSEGCKVECITNLYRGPVILRCGRTDIAIGRGMAERIMVEPVATTVAGRKGGVRHGFVPPRAWFSHRAR